MKIIVLAAGYGTRLHPLTLSTPKPLLRVGGKSILERTMEMLPELGDFDDVFVVTNAKYISHFDQAIEEFKKRVAIQQNIILVDDGTTSNETRLGPVGDIVLILKRFALNDDLLVIGADNLFFPTLKELCGFAREKKAPILAVFEFHERARVKETYGVVVAEESGRITSFEEKPINPKSALAATALYVFPKRYLKHLIELFDRPHQREVNAGEMIVQLLNSGVPVYCYPLTVWFDIGSHDDLRRAEDYYSGFALLGQTKLTDCFYR